MHNAVKMQEFRGLAFTKFTIFTAVSKTSLTVAGVPIGSKSLMVDAAVFTSGVRSNRLDVLCFKWKQTLTMNSILFIKAVMTSSLFFDRCLDSKSQKVVHYFTFILPVKSYLLHCVLRWLPQMHCHVTVNCNVKPYTCPHVRTVIMADTREILCSFITQYHEADRRLDGNRPKQLSLEKRFAYWQKLAFLTLPSTNIYCPHMLSISMNKITEIGITW